MAQRLDRIEVADRQIGELNKLAAAQMRERQAAVVWLIEMPGIGAEGAQEILPENGRAAVAFPSAAQLASWIAVCPGSNQSADHNRSGRSAKCNRLLRRLLCQAAQAAAKPKAATYQILAVAPRSL